MSEDHYKDHHAGKSAAERIASRLRNSGAGAHPDESVQKGDGPTRTFTNVHHAGAQTCVPQVDTRTKPTPKESNKGRFPSARAEDR